MTNTVEREQDIEFIADILMQIREYAITHNQEPDDTLRAVAEWILGLLEVATFNGDSEGEQHE